MAEAGKNAGKKPASKQTIGQAAPAPAARPPSPPKKARKDTTVAVVGGGIAGITAAIKLYRQGYDVTLFEKAERLGGNLSSNSRDDRYQERALDPKGDPTLSLRDVYPHIFAEWYNEFWYLLEDDLRLNRNELFTRSENIRMAILPDDQKKEVKSFQDVEYATIWTPTNLEKLVDNLQGKALSGRDMFLFGYSYLDLISAPTEGKQRSKVLNELDVNGHLHSRPYMNDAVAGFHDDTLKVIWSVPSEQTSAVAYQKLLRHTLTFPKSTPFAWLLKGPLHDKLMAPIEQKLSLALGKQLKLNTKVLELDLDRDNGPATLHWEHGGRRDHGTFDYVVLATPPKAAADLAIRSQAPAVAAPPAKPLEKLTDRHPLLARLREAQAGRIPVVHLYFTDKFWAEHKDELEHLPTELTGFRRRGPSRVDRSRGSTSGNYDISMLNIAAVWDEDSRKRHLKQAFEGEPVLVLAASHADAIEAPAPGSATWDQGKRQGFAMLKRFKEYFDFIDVGTDWGTGGHIDWSRTHVVSNSEHLLFLNTVSSNQWRPKSSLEYYKRAERPKRRAALNVFLAGDFCMTDVDMATVEAATQSGVQAARAVMYRHGEDHEAVPFQPHRLYTADALVVAKLAATPAAFAAALSATYEEAAGDPRKAATLPATAAVMAASYWTDWLRSAEHLVRLQMPGYRRDSHKEWDWRDVHRHDESMGVIQMAANVALALAVEGPAVGPRLKASVAEAMYQGWYQTVGRIYFPKLHWSLVQPDDAHRQSRTDDDDDDEDDPSDQPSAHRRGHSAPSTWKDLFGQLDGGTVAEAVTNTAFGAAAAGVRLMRQLKDERDRKSAPKPFSDHLRKAIRHGVEASERKATGYRYYNPPRALP